MGVFDSESFWRDKHLAKLPAIVDKEAGNIILAMDELLFPLCNENDLLITRYRFNQSLKRYLEDLGFYFITNETGIASTPTDKNTSQNKNIFELLCESPDNGNVFQNLIHSEMTLSPYSIIPPVAEMCQIYDITYQGPRAETVKKVNSKVYSAQLSQKLDLKNESKIVNSAGELESLGREYQKQKPFIIKDPYGVSGKGNMLITTESTFNRIVLYIKDQERKGMVAQFVLEPLLDKKLDFSCQLYIDHTGKTVLICVQKMMNQGFAYLGSSTANQEFMDYLSKHHYFSVIHQISKILFEDGYFGNVCIDSMMLQNGSIVPLVEINARKSMGLINYYIDKHLSFSSLQGNLTALSVGYSTHLDFEELLTGMKELQILFKPGQTSGIIPLSANTLFINRDLAQNENPRKVYKGRFYMSVIAGNEEERSSLIRRMREYLESLAFHVYN